MARQGGLQPGWWSHAASYAYKACFCPRWWAIRGKMALRAKRPKHSQLSTMHTHTAAAVRALVAALQAHPEDLLAMQPYGALPQHLIDFLDDHEDDLQAMEE